MRTHSAPRAEATGSFPNCVSPFGVSDLAGNVEEWVHNVSDTDFSKAAGGSFNNPTRCNQLIPRFDYDRHGYTGFRCCHLA